MKYITPSYLKKPKKQYLVALPSFRGDKGFNHPTILVSATDTIDCIDLIRSLRPHANIGEMKEIRKPLDIPLNV